MSLDYVTVCMPMVEKHKNDVLIITDCIICHIWKKSEDIQKKKIL